ncbi:MAG: RNA polymerase sigma factor [Patescibacteria group bacterium]
MVGEKEKKQLRLLAKKARAGDKQSFENLVLLTQEAIFRHCWRVLGNEYEAADACQETFVKFWFNLDKFDTRLNVLPYLYKIATNNCLDQLRKLKRLVHFDDLEVGGEYWQTNVACQGQKEAERQEMRVAVASLPKNYRAALSLYFFEGYKYQEIADMMLVPVNTVKSWIKRGKERLKEIV